MPLLSLIANPATLIAAVSPFIAKYIQNNAAQLEADKVLREAEMATAKTLAEGLSSSLDQLVYLNQEVMYAVVDRGLRDKNDKNATDVQDKEDQASWSKYKDVWEVLNIERRTNVAKIASSFGQKDMAAFNQVFLRLKKLNDELDSIYYGRTYYGVEPIIKVETYKGDRYFKDLKNLEADMNALNLSVYKKIQEQKVGSHLEPSDQVQLAETQNPSPAA